MIPLAGLLAACSSADTVGSNPVREVPITTIQATGQVPTTPTHSPPAPTTSPTVTTAPATPTTTPPPTRTANTYAFVSGCQTAGGGPVSGTYWPTDQGGCGGYLVYHATTSGGGHHWQWGFQPAFVGTCAIDVYIPDSPHASAPIAHYVVVDQPTHDNPPVTGFKIAQAIHHGQWITVGDYHTTGDFVVRIDDRGDGHSEVVADAVRVNCHRT